MHPTLLRAGACARLFCLLCTVALAGLSGFATPAGVWVGGTDLIGNFNLTELDFTARPHAPQGTVEIRATKAGPLALHALAVEGESLRFEVPTPRGLAKFSGKAGKDRLEGTLIDEFGAAKKLHAWRIATVEPADLAACTGFFQLGESTVEISIAPRGQLNVMLFSSGGGTETITRALRLLPRSATEFYTAAAVNGGLKFNETVRFAASADGRLQKLEWKTADGKTLTATRIADRYLQRQFEFTGPAGRLAGTLITPVGRGPFPLFVQVHGSGPATRDNIVLRARAWAQIGVATLLWDKRGTGDSDGDFRTAQFAEFAADAAAALAHARTLPEIDPARVGFQAQSEGGWVAAAAIRAGAQPDFVVMTSAGPIHPRDQELYRATTQPQRNGLSAGDAKAATEFMQLKWAAAFDEERFETYLAAARAAASQKWYPSVQGPLVADSSEWQRLRLLKSFDPVADFRAISVPTLVIVSSADTVVPGEHVAELWRQLWGAQPPAGSEIKVLPNLDHGLIARTQGRSTLVDPAAQNAIAPWMRAGGLLR